MFEEATSFEGSAATADHAHNAVLDLAVTTGSPGAVLAVAWAIVLPLLERRACLRDRADPALAKPFLRVWIFTVANCPFWSIPFARGDPMWFITRVAMFGLRHFATLRLNDSGWRISLPARLTPVRARP